MNFRANKLRLLTAAALLLSGYAPLYAQDAPPAPDVNATLDMLLQVNPADLVQRMEALKAEAAAKDAEVAKLRAQAEQVDAQAAALQQNTDALLKHVEALGMAFGLAPAPAPAPADTAMAAAPAMEAPAMAAPAEAEAAAVTVNFTDHVLPIFKANCLSCHNLDKRKSGLALDTIANTMEGGSSGKVVVPGDPDNSRILKLMMHTEEPFMPPSGDKLPDDVIAVVRQWIVEGAPADSSAKMLKKASNDGGDDAGGVFLAAQIPDGPPPMPEAALAMPATLPGRGVVARAMDTNPRSPLLAVGGYKQVILYNLDTFEVIGALPFPEGEISTLTFSVNGELLLAGGGVEGASGLCVLWNVRTGERVGTYGEYYDTVLAADISPDHKMIAAGGMDKKVRVYSAETGLELYKLEEHTQFIYSVRFTPDGEVLASADRDGGLHLWQAANGRHVEKLAGHTGAINAMEYTLDSKYLLTAGTDGTVQVWDTWAYNRVRSFPAHGAAVLNVDVSRDNMVLTTGADNTTKIFNLEGAEQKKFEGLPDWGYQARFGKEDTLILTGLWTGEIQLNVRESGEAAKTLSTNPVMVVASN